jgi:hypothetical protein
MDRHGIEGGGIKRGGGQGEGTLNGFVRENKKSLPTVLLVYKKRKTTWGETMKSEWEGRK